MRETCGKRVPYYKHLTGICARDPHGDDVDHIVELITPDLPDIDYTLYSRKEEVMGDVIKVTPDPKDGRTLVAFDLWLDGTELDEAAGWRSEVWLDFERFKTDRHYSAVVSDHIQTVLDNLAREVEEIGTQL